jgi:hypothetical protein
VDTATQIVVSGAHYVEDLTATVRAIWVHACRHDGIDPNSRSVVFSKDNPAVPYYDKALSKLLEAREGMNAFGYVPLVIGPSGRAEIYKRGKRRAYL